MVRLLGLRIDDVGGPGLTRSGFQTECLRKCALPITMGVFLAVQARQL